MNESVKKHSTTCSYNQYKFRECVSCAKKYTGGLMTESTEVMVPTHIEFTILEGYQTVNHLMLCDKCYTWDICTAFGS